MASPQLKNYLRSNRKRLGLSQKDVAFLLGARGGAKVCRYERFSREPSLETALAFEVIFQKPASELFAGLYKEVEQRVSARAKVLTYRKDFQNPQGRSTRKLEAIKAIMSR